MTVVVGPRAHLVAQALGLPESDKIPVGEAYVATVASPEDVRELTSMVRGPNDGLVVVVAWDLLAIYVNKLLHAGLPVVVGMPIAGDIKRSQKDIDQSMTPILARIERRLLGAAHGTTS